MPTSACPTRSSEGFIANRTARMMSVFARLKPGVTEEQAQADVATIAGRMKEAYSRRLSRQSRLRDQARLAAQRIDPGCTADFLVLLCTAGLVLLLACANTANLTWRA
jgi:hypothetical protein